MNKSILSLIPYLYVVNEFICASNRILRQEFLKEIYEYVVDWVIEIEALNPDYQTLKEIDMIVSNWDDPRDLRIYQIRWQYSQTVSFKIVFDLV